MLLLDGQVHHDTHVIPMGNYVIGVGNYVIVSPSDLGNYVSADSDLDQALACRFPGAATDFNARYLDAGTRLALPAPRPQLGKEHG